ncbi:MAG: SDR family NAD(P)-dependent oxidoreductase [Actinobacteria bacterium]|nr:SDR family NAD(P)-dependent oxidoreductase [Actinomycetota bacterium]
MARKRKLEGSTAIVTGGSSGIGLAAACLLASGGANVAIAARRTDVLGEAVALIRSAQTNHEQFVEATSLDVADRRAVADYAHTFARAHGTPDIIINSAGITHPGYFEEIPFEIFEEIMQVDYFGVLNVCRSFVPVMKVRGGHIVNVASAAGLYGVFGYTAYSAAKFAVVGFSQALRSELKPNGIRVSVLCPVDTDTPQLAMENELKPKETHAISSGTADVMTPETVAEALVDALFTNRFLIIPGREAKLAYLANRIAPGLLEQYLDGKIRRARSSAP